MKTIVLTFLLLTTSLASIHAQSDDYKLVAQTVSYYLDGGTNNNFETVQKAFHPNAIMRGIRGGKYMEINALEFFKKVIKPGPKQNRKTRIDYINISGNTASAKLEIEYPNFMFIDYMNLLKVDGEWKIVSKIYYRKSFENNNN